MTTRKCPQCGFTNFADAETCKRCDARLKVASEYEQLKQTVISNQPAQLPKVDSPAGRALQVEIASKKKPTFNLILWSIAGVGAVAGVITLIIALSGKFNALQGSSGFALAIALAVIPYCLARATDETTL